MSDSSNTAWKALGELMDGQIESVLEDGDMISLSDFIGYVPAGADAEECQEAWASAFLRSRSVSPQPQRPRETAEQASTSTAQHYVSCTQTCRAQAEAAAGSSYEAVQTAAAERAAFAARQYALSNHSAPVASTPATPKPQRGANQSAKRVGNKRRGSKSQKGHFPGPRALRTLQNASQLPHDVECVEDYAPAMLVNGKWREASFYVLWQNGEHTWEPASFFTLEVGIDAMLDWMDIIVDRARRGMGLRNTASGSVLGYPMDD
jgi:hypothetical protein